MTTKTETYTAPEGYTLCYIMLACNRPECNTMVLSSSAAAHTKRHEDHPKASRV